MLAIWNFKSYSFIIVHEIVLYCVLYQVVTTQEKEVRSLHTQLMLFDKAVLQKVTDVHFYTTEEN